MNDTIQSAMYKLHIVGPTNIGGNETLTTKDYLYNYDAGEVYLLNQWEWFAYLYKHKAVPSFEQYVTQEMTQPKGRGMYQWAVDTLGKHNVTRQHLGNAVSSMMKANRCAENRKNSLNDIIPHIRCIDGTIYTPGSSIKGMIDTAIIEFLIQTDHRFKRNIQQACHQLLQAYQNRDNRAQGRALRDVDSVIRKRMQCIPDGNNRINGAISSIFRGISISDAMPIDSITTEVLQKIDHGVGRDAVNDISVWREYILPGNELEFSITLDTSITQHVGIHSLEEVLTIIEQSQQRTRKLLKQSFKNIPSSVWQQGSTANAYLGGNTGFLHKTIIMAAFEDNPATGTDVIKAILSKQFDDHEHNIQDRVISPRMLKLTRWRNELWEVGGVRIERIK